MEKLNFAQIEEIIDKLESYGQGPEQWMDRDVSDYTRVESEEEYHLKLKLGLFKVVDEYGGEGQGDSYYAVYHFTDHDVFIKFNGYYSSWNGSEYTSMQEVRPFQRTVTVYE